jgi:hypothetical protein
LIQLPSVIVTWAAGQPWVLDMKASMRGKYKVDVDVDVDGKQKGLFDRQESHDRDRLGAVWREERG